MPHRLITQQSEFDELCEHMREAGLVAFDTEFISENTYLPELCLLQFATTERQAAVDPFEVDDLSAWWEMMCDDRTTVVVHGGQAEVRFCLHATERPPRRLVDVQLAEGLRSRGYPLSHQALVRRVLGAKTHGHETRTDWKSRPLSDRQIQYAVEDVKHLLAIWNVQRASLSQMKRLEWAEAEFERFVEELQDDTKRGAWLRLSGIHKLHGRELAVAVEIHRWREAEAARSNRPVRRVLRDDLVIDIARRQPKSWNELFAVRDMNRSSYRRVGNELLECISRGLELPDAELPEIPEWLTQQRQQDEQVLGKLLGIALANRCAELEVAMGLVGTSADLRRLARWHVQEGRQGPPPRLARGWRAEVCGNLLEDLLDGKISLRVGNPESDHPLVFQPTVDGRAG